MCSLQLRDFRPLLYTSSPYLNGRIARLVSILSSVSGYDFNERAKGLYTPAFCKMRKMVPTSIVQYRSHSICQCDDISIVLWHWLLKHYTSTLVYAGTPIFTPLSVQFLKDPATKRAAPSTAEGEGASTIPSQPGPWPILIGYCPRCTYGYISQISS